MTVLFGIYLVLLILRPYEFVPALNGVPIMLALMMLCLLIWIFRPDKRASLPPFVLLFWMMFLMPLTVAINGWWGGYSVAFVALFPSLAVFILATMAGRGLRALHVYMRLILLCGCVLVYHSQVQLNTGFGPLTGVEPYEGRPYYLGIFNDPNDLGQLFVLALTFALYLLTITPRRSWRLFLWSAIVYLFYGIMLTNSRGALLAALAVIAFEGWRRYGKIAVGVAAVIALPALFAVTRLNQLNASEQSANDRIQAWYEGIQMLRSHPFFGIGIGNFTNFNALTAHNFIVLPMAELGFFGFLLWFGFIWYSVRMLWWVAYGPHAKLGEPLRIESDSEQGREILAARALMLTFIGFGISAFFLSQSYKAPLFLLCGLAVARFTVASRLLPNPPSLQLLAYLPRLSAYTLTCMFGMWLIVKLNV
jgi:putative inorganic carbon (HCO3(-)) transporter